MRMISARSGWSGRTPPAASLTWAAVAVLSRDPHVAARTRRRIRYRSAAASRVSGRCRSQVLIVRWTSGEASRVSRPVRPASARARSRSWKTSRPASPLLVAVSPGRHPRMMPDPWLTSVPIRAEQLEGQGVGQLPADDQHVHQVQGLEHDRRLFRFDRQGDDAGAAELTAVERAAERAAPEVVVLSTQPALVHLLDLSGFVLSQAVAGNPDPADVADREAEHVRVFGVGGLPVPGVVRFTGALAGRDVADAGQDHRHVFDEAAWAFEDHAVVLGVAGHPPGDAVCVVLIDGLGDPGRPAAQRGGLRVGTVRGQDAGRVAGIDPPGFLAG